MSESVGTLGQRLQAARGKKGLSAQKVADALRLDGWVIEGLESGDYQRIGPSVYAKGHLKRYAELLGLPVAEVLADFDAALPEPLSPQAAGLRAGSAMAPAGELPWSAIIGCAALAVALAGLMWWRPWLPRSTAAAEGRAPSAVRPTPPAPPAQPAPLAQPALEPLVAAPAMQPEGGAGRARLRLSFIGDSWVDVHDATGQRLFAGTGHVNNVRSMSGEAPFRIYLKSAGSIRLEINNHPVAIGTEYVVGDVAHFEAGADGILRRDLRAAPTTGLAAPDVAPSMGAPAAAPSTRPHG
jgi:cytoskeleton protein RodZ